MSSSATSQATNSIANPVRNQAKVGKTQNTTNVGRLSTGQNVFKFEDWFRLIAYQVANAAMTAACVWIGMITANPFMIGASLVNGTFQSILMFADWSYANGQLSHVSILNAALSCMSVGYLSQALKSGMAGLSIFGGIITTVLYGIQLHHLNQKNS
jgi:hypothetical protein